MRLSIGDIVRFGETGEIGIVLSVKPTRHSSPYHNFTAVIKWSGDADVSSECADDPSDIHIVARASGS